MTPVQFPILIACRVQGAASRNENRVDPRNPARNVSVGWCDFGVNREVGKEVAELVCVCTQHRHVTSAYVRKMKQ